MQALVLSTDEERAEEFATALRLRDYAAAALEPAQALERLTREPASLVVLDLAALHDTPGLVRRVRLGPGADRTWILGLVDPESPREALRSALEAQVDDFCVWPGSEAELSVRLRLAAQRASQRTAPGEPSFRALVERLPALLGVVAQDGRLLYVNPEAARVLGFAQAAELLGTSVETLVPREERAEAALRAATLAHAAQGSARERQLLHRSGRKLDVELLTFPLHFEGQDALVTLGRDVTERRAQQAEWLSRERLASFGMLAAGVAHEVNNPLAYVDSNLVFAREVLDAQQAGRAPTPDVLREVRQALAEAQEGAGRLQRLMRALRTFAQDDAGKEGPVQLPQVLDTALHLASNVLRPRARVVRDYGNVPPVWGSPGQLGQVFFNLLLNAAQAITPGDVEHHSVTVSLQVPTPGWVSASVQDSGSGIAPEHLERLFTPFFTTRRAGEGPGLGLSICRKLVQGMGGEVRAHSVLGEGSTFEVLLPCAPSAGAAAPPPREPAAAEPRARILLVDDDVLVSRAFERLLRPYHDVTSFQRARAALEWLRTGVEVDVLFCDLMMPDMGGVELFSAIAAARPGLLSRVVLVTGGESAPEVRRFVEALVHQRLDKPFDRDQVLALVRQVRSGAASTP